jgi:hypothetical protein
MDPKHQDDPTADALERQIEAWRSHLRRSRAIADTDAEELEDHLREQIATLGEHGLSEDEAFLVAVKRMGAIDALTREFAREHSERLWKQLVLAGDGSGVRRRRCAVFVRIPDDVGRPVPGRGRRRGDQGPGAFRHSLRSGREPVLPGQHQRSSPSRSSRPTSRGSGRSPLRVGYGWPGRSPSRPVLVNAFPFSLEPAEEADTLILTVLHLPIALWLAVGVAYVGGRWRGSERRMDFIRFTGEVFIYYVLIALGGGVLIGLTFVLFGAIGVDVEPLVQSWILPCGIAGAAVVATWLVEAKQSVIENMAPVLARTFIPLFALVLLAFVVTMVATGRGIDVEREILIAVDLLLVVVFGLLLYSISARDPLAPPGIFDSLQLTLVGTALLVDALALWAIGSRISGMGWTPNRFAALGMNVVLLVNLVGSAVPVCPLPPGGVVFSRLWDWQTTYLYVLGGWAAVVAFLFPVLFGFR